MIRQPSTARTVIGGGGRLFDPSQLPGLAAWYSADYGVLSQATNAASFVAANNESLSITNNASIQTGIGPWCITAWINPTAINESEFGVYLNKAATSSGNLQEFAIYRPANGSSSLRYVVSNASGDNRIQFDISNVFAAGRLVFLHFGWDGTNAFCSVNNAPPTTTTLANVYQSTGPFSIGGSAPWGYYTSSTIGLVGFWKRNLTSEERTFLYNNGTGQLYVDLPSNLKTSMISYWNLTETSGTRNDSHGFNHLTDNNTVGYASGPYAAPANDGQPVRRWLDRSGNGRHLEQPILLNQPTVSGGVLYSLKTMETLAATLPQPLTIFAAARSTATGSGDNYILGQWTGSAMAGRWTMYYNLGNNRDIYVQRVSGADNRRVTGQQANVLQIWLGRIAASTGSGSVTFTVAGVSGSAQSVGSSGVGTTPSLPITMGQLTSNVPMTVYEVGLTSGEPITNEDLQKISVYLSRKWGAV